MDKKNICAIVQTRTLSSRLPRKALEKIEQRPMIWHVLNRLSAAKKIGKIILAVPEADKKNFKKFAKEFQAILFGGSALNVLSRYYKAARESGCQTVVRITGDNPFLDPVLIDRTVKEFINSNGDYASTKIIPTYPEGLRVEVFSFEALEAAFKSADKPHHKEHVTPYIYENPGKFKIVSIESPKNYSHLRWTVDEKKDLEFARIVYKNVGKNNRIFKSSEVIKFLEKNPEIKKINAAVTQKEVRKKWDLKVLKRSKIDLK